MLRIISLVVLATLLVSATTAVGLLPTNLKITIIDELGNVVEGATVKLYETEEDYRADENASFGPALTNEKGIVKFKELKPISYYIYVEKGDQRNDGAGVLTGELEEGKVNKVNVVIY